MAAADGAPAVVAAAEPGEEEEECAAPPLPITSMLRVFDGVGLPGAVGLVYASAAAAAGVAHNTAGIGGAAGGSNGSGSTIVDVCGVLASTAVTAFAPRVERQLRTSLEAIRAGHQHEGRRKAKRKQTPREKADDLVAYGEALVEEGEYVDAIDTFNAAVEVDPTHPRAYIDRGVAYYHLDMHDLCVADCDLQLEVSRAHAPEAYSNRAAAQEALSEYDAAFASWDLAIQAAKGIGGAAASSSATHPAAIADRTTTGASGAAGGRAGAAPRPLASGVEVLDDDDDGAGGFPRAETSGSAVGSVASPMLPYSMSHPGYAAAVGRDGDLDATAVVAQEGDGDGDDALLGTPRASGAGTADDTTTAPTAAAEHAGAWLLDTISIGVSSAVEHANALLGGGEKKAKGGSSKRSRQQQQQQESQKQRTADSDATSDDVAGDAPSTPKPYDHLLLRKGALALKIGRFSDAFDSFNDVLALVPECAAALAGRADASIREYQYQRPCAAGGGGVSTATSAASSAMDAEAEAARQVVYDTTLADINKAVEMEPGNSEYYSILGRVLACGGNDEKLREASYAFTMAIELGDESAGVYSNRGYVWKALREVEAALKDFAKACELDPASPMVHLEIADILSAAGSHVAAVKEANAALQLDANRWQAYNTRGTIYHRMRRQREAVLDYRRAVELLAVSGLDGTPEHRTVMRNLATAMRR